jgi:phosphoserine phosphatase RsbU/P
LTVSDALTIPSRTTAIDDARRWVSAHLREGGAADDTVWAVELALTEALANVDRHAYGGDENREIRLELELDDDRLELRIHHTGEPFDPASYVPPDLEAAPPPSGYGIHLLGELLDEVVFEDTEMRLVKRLKERG